MLGLLEHPFRPTFRKDVQGYNDVILLYEHFRGCSLRLRLGPWCQERVYMRGREQEAAGRKRALWALCWAIWNWDPHILWWTPIPLILNTHQHSHFMIPNDCDFIPLTALTGEGITYEAMRKSRNLWGFHSSRNSQMMMGKPFLSITPQVDHVFFKHFLRVPRGKVWKRDTQFCRSVLCRFCWSFG